MTVKARSHRAKENVKAKKNQRTIGKDQRKNFKHQKEFSLSRLLSFGANRPLQIDYPKIGNNINFAKS